MSLYIEQYYYKKENNFYKFSFEYKENYKPFKCYINNITYYNDGIIVKTPSFGTILLQSAKKDRSKLNESALYKKINIYGQDVYIPIKNANDSALTHLWRTEAKEKAPYTNNKPIKLVGLYDDRLLVEKINENIFSIKEIAFNKDATNFKHFKIKTAKLVKLKNVRPLFREYKNYNFINWQFYDVETGNEYSRAVLYSHKIFTSLENLIISKNLNNIKFIDKI